jgi:hypothetical protein
VYTWITQNLIKSVTLRRRGNLRGARRIYRPSVDAMFERFARNNAVDVRKLSEKLGPHRDEPNEIGGYAGRLS